MATKFLGDQVGTYPKVWVKFKEISYFTSKGLGFRSKQTELTNYNFTLHSYTLDNTKFIHCLYDSWIPKLLCFNYTISGILHIFLDILLQLTI